MKHRIAKGYSFLVNWIYPVLDVVLFFLAIFIAISSILLWAIIEPWSNALLNRIVGVFLHTNTDLIVNYGWLVVNIPKLLIIMCLILIPIRVKCIYQYKFWLNAIPLLGILVVSWLSRHWSVARPFSEERFLYFSSVFVFGLYFGLSVKLSKIRWLLEIFFAIAVLGSFYAVIREPNFAITNDPQHGIWRGVFWWKSYMGQVSGLAAAVFLFRWADFRNNRWYSILFGFILYLLSIYALIRSSSVTQMLALIVVHIVLVIFVMYDKWWFRLKTSYRWAGVAVLSIAVLMLWIGRDKIFSLFGRTSTLTGRIPLWEALVPYIENKLMLGYGFGEAFWKYEVDQVTIYQREVSHTVGWSVPFAHNGFIEVLLGLGLVGLILWIIFIVQTTYLSYQYHKAERTITSLIFLGWISYMVVINLADNMLGSYENLTVLLLTIAFGTSIRKWLEVNVGQKNESKSAISP